MLSTTSRPPPHTPATSQRCAHPHTHGVPYPIQLKGHHHHHSLAFRASHAHPPPYHFPARPPVALAVPTSPRTRRALRVHSGPLLRLHTASYISAPRTVLACQARRASAMKGKGGRVMGSKGGQGQATNAAASSPLRIRRAGCVGPRHYGRERCGRAGGRCRRSYTLHTQSHNGAVRASAAPVGATHIPVARPSAHPLPAPFPSALCTSVPSPVQPLQLPSVPWLSARSALARSPLRTVPQRGARTASVCAVPAGPVGAVPARPVGAVPTARVCAGPIGSNRATSICAVCAV
ncbi:hypothetical protein PLICRDRAFT_180394 [Plicaturopsis crispa FD-325 SS-3]|uniref:Uncharacterized protein n=1 Tax=Plicaturopsis crispa FD-325 SS-3 TaxID=944288 RepID=A0A0C9SW45_PLICR|nr:hypothetical protein PLICRDRAFT_180394 [Plicaturopsis crispa FD-325 SS-3]